MKAVSRVLVFALALVSFYSLASTLEERIGKVGSVCLESDDCAKNLVVAAGGAKSAEEIYNTSCLACHTSGAAGAPKIRNAADWADRLSAGIDTVYANAINGKGAMPPRGLCGTCSDDDIKGAVDYMIEGL